MSKTMLFVKLGINALFVCFSLTLMKRLYLSNQNFRVLVNYYALLGGAAWFFFVLPDSAERILLYSFYIEAIIITVYCINEFKQGRYESARLRSISLNAFYKAFLGVLFLIIYASYIFMHPSIIYTLGDLAFDG